LSWINQNFIRNETLTEANACLVAAQNSIPLVHRWGGGEVASADGLRFVVPVRTIHAGPNPKYFGYELGVTYYNLVSDQYTGLSGIVVPGTLRDESIKKWVLARRIEETFWQRNPWRYNRSQCRAPRCCAFTSSRWFCVVLLKACFRAIADDRSWDFKPVGKRRRGERRG
jgi:hypothetical protein